MILGSLGQFIITGVSKNMPKRLTQEEVKQCVEKAGNGEYELLSEYKNANSPITLKHKICGQIYDVSFNNFYYQHNRCSCQNKYAAKPDSFYSAQFLKQIGDRQLSLLGVTRGRPNRPHEVGLDLHCHLCDKDFNMTFSHFERGDKCSCQQPNRRKSDDEWKKIFYDVFQNKCDIEEFNRGEGYIKYRCKKCGKVDIITLSHLCRIENWECFCENHYRSGKRKTWEEWEFLFYQKADRSIYRLLKLTPIKGRYHYEFLHIPSNEIFFMQPDNFETYFSNGYKSGGRRPNIISWGERAIEKYLTEHNILFKQQYRFIDCKLDRQLRFDFAVLDDHDTVRLLIEFDGQQHYHPVSLFGGEKTFKYVQLADQTKNTYCDTHNLKLLRIPYWEYDNIENILQEELL